MIFSNFFIPKILGKIRQETDHNEENLDMIRYSLEAILGEVEKMVYLIIIFLLLGRGWHFLVAVLAIFTIRPSAGGFHSSTMWGCFLWTLSGLVAAILLLPHVPMSALLVVGVAIFSLIVTYIASPLRSKQKELIADKTKDQQKKIQVTMITLIWFVLIFLNYNHFLAPVALWVIFLQNVQLLIEYMRKRLDIR